MIHHIPAHCAAVLKKVTIKTMYFTLAMMHTVQPCAVECRVIYSITKTLDCFFVVPAVNFSVLLRCAKTLQTVFL